MKDQIVRPGDCFSSIAHENGFRNYLTLYDANAELASRRRNPNMLVPGDIVKVPDKRVKSVSVALDREHAFTIDQQPTMLRIRVLDAEDKRPSVKSVSLRVGNAKTTTMDKTGLMELTISPLEKTGYLTVVLKKWKPENAPNPAGVPSPAPYPPPIVPANFAGSQPETDGEDVEITWELDIGSLEPPATDPGCRQRLENLGFSCKNGDGQDQTVSAVKAYQRKNKLPDTGSIADVRADLEVRHDR